MGNFQEFDKTAKKIYPIKSILQLALSYEIAVAIREVREDFRKGEMETALKHLPPLEVDNPDERAVKLYERFASMIKLHPLFTFVAKFAIEDMHAFNFKADSSVMTNLGAGEIAHLNEMFSNSYTQLAKVDLFEHTLDVFEIALEKISSLGRIGGKEIIIISSLLHDFGKSTGIRERLLGTSGMGQQASTKHHPEVSAMYVREILVPKIESLGRKFSFSTFDAIENAVQNHHSKAAQYKKDPVVSSVREFDMEARKEEMRKLISTEK